MKDLQELLKIVVIVLFTAGGFLIFKNYYDIQIVKIEKEKTAKTESKNSKVATLKKFLVGQKKPERIEIFGLTKRFEKDVDEIKKIKIPLDKNSDFYMAISFFTNESNDTSPLVAQIRFVDLATGNLLKEESINLE